MAREESRWGRVRIAWESHKLGIRVSATTIRTLLRRYGLGRAPRRSRPTWTCAPLQVDHFRGPPYVLTSAHVFVRSGTLVLSTGNGIGIRVDAASAGTGQWESLEGYAGRTPCNEIAIRSKDSTGVDADIDLAVVVVRAVVQVLR
jgi:hypothetical protein